MRSVAVIVLLAWSLFACKKKPDPAELAGAPPSASSAAAPAAAPGGSGAAKFAGFEGRLQVAVKGRLGGGADKPLDLALGILVKNGKLRADVPPGVAPGDAGPVYLIIEAEAKRVYAVMETKKQAMLFDLEKLAPQLEAMAKGVTRGAGGAGGTGGKPMSSATKTGKNETVAGYTCEIWQVTHESKKMELCVMTDEQAWLKLPEAALPPQLGWAKELTDGRHIPLRYVAVDADGKEAGRVEITSVEKKTLPASDFEVPKGFVIVSFDQMMSGLGGLMGGAGGLPGMKGLPPGLKLPPGMALPSGFPTLPQPKRDPAGKKPSKP
jgi:hypothetical protein